MSAGDSNLVEIKSLLLGMAAEADDLKQAAGGCVTDAVAGWLAPQYAAAARKQLAVATDAEHFNILRTFVQDWTMLRHGDHTAERLYIERERLKLSKRDIKQKWETKIDAGLNALKKQVKIDPKIRAAFGALRELVSPDIKLREEKKFREWLKKPEIRKEIFLELTRGLSPETLKKVEAELHLVMDPVRPSPTQSG
jgi:hypothetical protein